LTAGTALCRDRNARDGTREGVIMKKNRVMVLGMAAIALTFGLVLAGCGDLFAGAIKKCPDDKDCRVEPSGINQTTKVSCSSTGCSVNKTGLRCDCSK
jgi:hypothetical protein